MVRPSSSSVPVAAVRLEPAGSRHRSGSCGGLGRRTRPPGVRAAREPRGTATHTGAPGDNGAPGAPILGRRRLADDVRVSDRLSSLDASFLYLEEPTTADARRLRHGVRRRRASGVRLRELVDLISRAHRPRPALPPEDPRGARPPRQPGVGRRRVLRHQLPRAPGGPAAAGHRRAARGVRRPDPAAPARPHPPAVGGLPRRGPGATDRFAIITKTHHALVDGISAVDIAQRPGRRRPPGRARASLDTWRARPEPSGLELVAGAVTDAVRTPEPGRSTSCASGVDDVRDDRGRGGVRAGDAGLDRGPRRRPAGARRRRSTRRSARPAATSWSAPTSTTTARSARGWPAAPTPTTSPSTTSILATVAGAFRAWLLTRGEPVYPGSTIRAMVPVSVYDGDRRRPPCAPGHRLLRRPAGRGARRRRCACTRSPSRCASRWRAATPR